MKSGKILIALLLVLPFLAAEAISAAEVSFYIGDVSLYRNSKKISPDMGMKLKSGDVIRTGKNSSVDIVYADSSTIKIAENSTARIGSASVKESDDIALVSGSLKGKFAKIKKGRHRVYTPTIICGIRGTEFSIGVEKGGTSRLDLDKGNIHVKNPYGERQVKPSEKVEAGVGEEPEDVENGSSIKDWKNKKEKEFMDDPEDRADDYSDYVDKFKENSEEASGSMKDYKKLAKTKEKKELGEAGDKIDTAEDQITDELMLNETVCNSIDGIMTDFRTKKKKLYSMFEKVKKESNRVLEVQQENYKAIKAIKEEYKKNYEMIKGQFRKDKENILKGVDFESFKPKMKK